MSVHTSAVTTKGQTTVPEAIRKALSALAGCLASDVPFPGAEKEKAAARSLRAAHLARKHRLTG